MPSDYMLALGDYRFSVGTASYSQLRRVSEWRWSSQDRVGQEPLQQYVGPGQDSITLNGVIYPHYRGGLGQIAAMRSEAGKGVALLLVDGLGNIHGKWVITRIEENQSYPLSDGLPQKIEFRLAIKAYGEAG